MLQVQHPVDRGGDLLFLPIRVLMEPLASFVSRPLAWRGEGHQMASARVLTFQLRFVEFVPFHAYY